MSGVIGDRGAGLTWAPRLDLPISPKARAQVMSSQVKSTTSKSSQVCGLRSTFDRLLYGCLLFMYMYRLELTWRRTPGRDEALYTSRPRQGQRLGSGSVEEAGKVPESELARKRESERDRTRKRGLAL